MTTANQAVQDQLLGVFRAVVKALDVGFSAELDALAGEVADARCDEAENHIFLACQRLVKAINALPDDEKPEGW